MTRADAEKLLGGYAAGTLTPAERRALFEAALADQSLFDSLADEEALREVLADPACRGRILAALAEPPRAWLRSPIAWTAAGALAAAAVIFVVMANWKPAPVPTEIAMATKPAPPATLKALSTPTRETRNAPAPARLAAKPAPPPSAVSAPAPPSLASRLSATEPSAPPPSVTAPPPPVAVTAAVPPPPPPQQGGALGGPRSVSPKTATPPPPPPQQQPGVAGGVAPAAPMVASRAVPAPNVPALRYALIRRAPGAEQAEVPADTVFAPGESPRLRIEPSLNGYLYVLAGDRALFSGAVTANSPLLVDVAPGTLDLILLSAPDPGPLATLLSRTRQQLAAANLQSTRKAAVDSASVAAPRLPVLVEVPIRLR